MQTKATLSLHFHQACIECASKVSLFSYFQATAALRTEREKGRYCTLGFSRLGRTAQDGLPGRHARQPVRPHLRYIGFRDAGWSVARCAADFLAPPPCSVAINDVFFFFLLPHNGSSEGKNLNVLQSLTASSSARFDTKKSNLNNLLMQLRKVCAQCVVFSRQLLLVEYLLQHL